ncbi:MAG: 50S ribosomal protein L19e [Methanosaeta sp. PtaB.Bin039]|nr:MAG: 50S ribosomal protein L19e [Methanosaeta sp. PtaB.Bin039]HOT07490.1 50S ribosomal protein L19e [Methanotrichaceae archaeon]HQF16985.1 50S ribosomal protein L19e [Methanotrichaceae archaeon]HQI91605.1 50S ribosomal protein L19e [Methanotrichaceae archaeon]HQJ28901.1 50S ribosomal protein L19e [Methanotrichaceae archaeon]
MPDFSTQKRLAASELGVGKSRVWVNPDPEVAGDLTDAITRDDIRAQIEAGNIKAKPKKGNSRARYRARAAKRAYGHCKGPGHRKGCKGARNPGKDQWMSKIRALRRKLREMRDGGAIDRHSYRMLYRKAKGGEYRSTAHLSAYVKAKGLIRSE